MTYSKPYKSTVATFTYSDGTVYTHYVGCIDGKTTKYGYSYEYPDGTQARYLEQDK